MVDALFKEVEKRTDRHNGFSFYHLLRLPPVTGSRCTLASHRGKMTVFIEERVVGAGFGPTPLLIFTVNLRLFSENNHLMVT